MTNCETCGAPVKERPPSARAARFCSLSCYHASMRGVNRVPVVAGERLRMAKGHPIAPASGRIAEARLVLYDKIGPGKHACNWCGTSIEWMPGAGPVPGAIMADHLDWDRTNNAPENVVAACHNCNAHRTRAGDRRRIEDGEPVVVMGGRRTRAIKRVCETCGKTFLIAPAALKRGRGTGRYCSYACRRTS